MNARDYWLVGTAPRACELCDHGATGACTRADVQGRGRPVGFDQARGAGGACGPDARYLAIKGFDYLKELS